MEVSNETDSKNYWGILNAFRDSNTLILNFDENLHITFDSAKSWRTIDEIGDDFLWVIFDEFHKDRAFVTRKPGGMRVTEDQGRSWKLLSLPEEIEDKKPCYLQTHPFNRNFLLLHCGITRESQDSPSFKEDVAYASDDAGKSFRRIVAPADEGENAPDLQYRGTTCLFATSSKESTLDKDGIYCVHKLGRKPTIEKQLSLPFSLPYDIDPIKKAFIEATYLDPELYAVGSVFYTRDLGQSTILFDELKSFSVKDMYILPYHILIITSEENDDENTAKRLWVSRGGPFKPAQLPKGAVFSPNNIPKVLS